MRGDWCFFFDYAEFVRRWRGAARGDLRTLSYENARIGSGIIQAFLRVLGFSRNVAMQAKGFQARNVGQYNSSVSVRCLDLWRMKRKVGLIGSCLRRAVSAYVQPDQLGGSGNLVKLPSHSRPWKGSCLWLPMAIGWAGVFVNGQPGLWAQVGRGTSVAIASGRAYTVSLVAMFALQEISRCL